MILDISGIELIPGNQGIYCPGNGMQKDVFGLPIECCCDECDYYICCYVNSIESACFVCSDQDCPNRQK